MYEGYEIPEVQDLNNQWYTFTGNITIISENVLFDTGISLNEISKLKREEINAFIFDQAKKLVDDIKEIENGKSESEE